MDDVLARECGMRKTAFMQFNCKQPCHTRRQEAEHLGRRERRLIKMKNDAGIQTGKQAGGSWSGQVDQDPIQAALKQTALFTAPTCQSLRV